MANAVLTEMLCGNAEFIRLRESLEHGEGPMSVFGLGEAHRIQTAASLYVKLNKTVLLVEASSLAAVKAREELLHYVPEALLFPARELPLSVRRYTESPSVTAQRLSCITALDSGEPCFIVTSIEALMQRMAPPEKIASATRTVRPGMRTEPEALLKRFIDAG